MKLVNIVGARPQFIKLGPVLRALQQYRLRYPDRRIHEILIHTGQHYDYEMSRIFFDELELKEPDYHLGIGAGSHGYQTGEMLKRVEEVLLREQPDIVIVYGDTNTTFAGALAAAKLHISVAHVEAGLRSGRKTMPEEINRVLTDHISDLLFCPTEVAVKNLEREGITQGVFQVGDVMYDSILHNIRLADQRRTLLEQLGLKPKGYVLATVHRAENTDNPARMRTIFDALDEVSRDIVPVIVPLHPRTRNQIQSLELSFSSVRLIEAISYLDMLLLEKEAKVILTDSGGVQKEAYFLRVPCVTLRTETEWVETVEAGWNLLVGADRDRIILAVRAWEPPSNSPRLFGDGQAAEHIVRGLLGG